MTVLTKAFAFGVMGVLSAGAAHGQIADDFEIDSSADYTVLAPVDGSVTFAYDYSADGIASAPNSTGGTTSGLRITANDTGGTGTPDRHATLFHNTGIALTDYTLTVDVYMNVSGSGSTEFGNVGVAGNGADKNSIFTPVAGSGHFVSFTGEGGSSSDFRHSTPTVLAVPTGDVSYLNSTNTTNATGDTYQSIFSAANGYSDFPGSPGNNWATLTIGVSSTSITYSFNGVGIIQTAFDGSDGNQVSLSYADIFSSVASPFQAQFVIFDNLTVAVPEPGSLALLSLGGLAMLRRRVA